MQRRRVARDGAFEFEAFALGQYRDSMISDRPAQQHAISRPRLIGGEPHAGRDESNSRSVHEQSVAASFFHDLGVAGDDNHRRQGGSDANGFHNPAEGIERKPFFEDERKAQKKRFGAAHRQVIHRSVHRQRSDVAAGKEQRLHDERVCCKRDSRSAELHDGLVIQPFEDGILQGRQEDISQEVPAHPAAASVTQQNRFLGRDRHRTIQGHIEFRFWRHQWFSPAAIACRRYW